MSSYEFQCGSPVCRTHFTAPSRDVLLGRVLAHVKDKHHIPVPTKSILQFVEENTIHETDTTGAHS